MRILLVILLLAVALPAPLRAQDAVTQPTGTISVEDSAERDSAIATRIRDILGELDGYSDVTVTVSSGIVTLRGTTLDAAAAARLNELVGRVEGVVAIENEVTESTDVVERLNPAVERFQSRIAQTLAFLPLLAVAGVVFAVIVFAGFLLAAARRPWDRLAPNAFIADIYRQLVRLTFVIGGLVVALDILNATALLSTILGAAGIIGLAIGFAVRDTVENFIASVMLSIRQPFRPNDTVEINGDTGNVIRLTSRATILLSFDGNHIRIPNATVFKSRIVNFTRNAERRFVFDLGVAPETDLAAARTLAEDSLKALPFVIETPAVNVWIEALGDSTVILRATAWINQHETSWVAARGEAIRVVKAAFDAAGIEMPEPTFRILGGFEAPQAPPEKARGRRTPAAPPAPDEIAAEAGNVGAEAEQQLERIVEAERAAPEREDLLSAAAPEE